MPSDTFVGDSSGAQGESGSGEVVGDKGKGKQIEDEDEDAEIEFEKDDEGIKYATHEGFKFDASFINWINDPSTWK
ncbi:hypothetical protein L1987_43459 [Smallanthus sonchifolius]|uniref:Uncharacterized protein n=1 Tax=Smallanthus sonchifolius TaxID=185202 RepID=A0ACB9GMP2_9ASTR|nr:hypothetical protein L1987_43459 [Smallanthus sonchifolius]